MALKQDKKHHFPVKNKKNSLTFVRIEYILITLLTQSYLTE